MSATEGRAGEFLFIRRAQQFPAGVSVHQVEPMRKFAFHFAKHGEVASRFTRQTLRLRFSSSGKSKQMTFARIRPAAHDDGVIGFIQIDEFVELEVGRRDGADQRAIG